MTDWGYEAQKAAEKHMEAVWDAHYAWEEGDETAESPASAPFCGCETCVVREILHAGWTVFEESVRVESSQGGSDGD